MLTGEIMMKVGMLTGEMMMKVGMLTGETMTREARKRRSAKQRAASRWWKTDAIDLEKTFSKIFPKCLQNF